MPSSFNSPVVTMLRPMAQIAFSLWTTAGVRVADS